VAAAHEAAQARRAFGEAFLKDVQGLLGILREMKRRWRGSSDGGLHLFARVFAPCRSPRQRFKAFSAVRIVAGGRGPAPVATRA
jgi:hypothetical protein